MLFISWQHHGPFSDIVVQTLVCERLMADDLRGEGRKVGERVNSARCNTRGLREVTLGDIESEDGGSNLLKLRKNLCRLKQGNQNWFKHHEQGLRKRTLAPSEVDPCLYLKAGLSSAYVHVDDYRLSQNNESKSIVAPNQDAPLPNKSSYTGIPREQNGIEVCIGMELPHGSGNAHVPSRELQPDIKLDA
eukprot:scaffold11466_cov99-Skeletonema_dohrnii-CCMP3373.AAC.6